ncbi:hypothetical protein U1Q18_035572 [Sarracenia purpurea var. burkii]
MIKNEDVVQTDAAKRTDDGRTSFESIDMFDLGINDSNNGEAGDNESGGKGVEEINAEGGDKEQNAEINYDMTASLMRKLEILQEANTKVKVECGGLMLTFEKMNDEMCSL